MRALVVVHPPSDLMSLLSLPRACEVYERIISAAKEYFASGDIVYHMRSSAYLKMAEGLDGAIEIHRCNLDEQIQAVMDDMKERGVAEVVISGFRRSICVPQVANYLIDNIPSVPLIIAEELCL